MRSTWAALCLVSAVACGGGGSGTADGPGSGDYDAPPGFGALMPKVIAGDPTDIMATPKGMAISWDNDPNRAQEDELFTELNKSTWATMTAEYGVGPITQAPPGHIAGNFPATFTEQQALQLLSQHLTGSGSDSWGPPDASTIYMFFIPAGMQFDDGTGDYACGGSAVGQSACNAQENATGGGYDGYHFDTMIGGVDVAYAIVGTCDCEALGLGISDLDDMMVTAGHEAVEAATDPRTAFADNIGFGEVDDAHNAWEYATEGELADMCEYASTEDWVSPPMMDFSIQRSWSNAAAAAGHDPCVGDGMSTYYQTIPSDPDIGSVNFEGFNQPAAGTKIAVGSAGTIDFQIYSDDPNSGPYNIRFYDWDGNGDVLSIQPTTASFKPGDKVSVPVTVKKASPYVDGGEMYEVDTYPVGHPEQFTSWYAWVLQ